MALKRDVYKLVKDKGQQLTLERSTSSYDPTTGETTKTTNQYAISGKFSNYDQSLIDGSLVKEGDRQLFISPVNPEDEGTTISVEPATGDTIEGSREVVQVVSIQTIEESGEVLGYKAQVRHG